MGTVKEEIKEIRTQLRLAMNGVISTSMREKGIVYKLNFGVSYPEIREIARTHAPSAELASALWGEDIRECKILATFLRPDATCSLDEARQWVREIPYLEIAEHCSRNLFAGLPCMEELVLELISDTEDKFARTVAFLVWAESFKKGGKLFESHAVLFLEECMVTIANDNAGISLSEKRAAIQALKFYGRQSGEQGKEILARFEPLRTMFESKPAMEEIYNDLKFEFDYYQ